MAEHHWTKTYANHGMAPYDSTAVVDVEDGCVVVSYELLAEMLISLGFIEREPS